MGRESRCSLAGLLDSGPPGYSRAVGQGDSDLEVQLEQGLRPGYSAIVGRAQVVADCWPEALRMLLAVGQGSPSLSSLKHGPLHRAAHNLAI